MFVPKAPRLDYLALYIGIMACICTQVNCNSADTPNCLKYQNGVDQKLVSSLLASAGKATKNDKGTVVVRSVVTVPDKNKWLRQLDNIGVVSGINWLSIRAEVIETAKRDPQILLILRRISQISDGTDGQTLILLDGKGQITDKIQCEIHRRLTESAEDSFYTKLVGKNANNDIRFMIRLDGQIIHGNFEHFITYCGRRYSFGWNNSENAKEPTKWDKNGLCQFTVENGKFKVVFPQNIAKSRPN